MTSAGEWAGPVGDAWASEWRRTDRSFAGLALHLDAVVRDAATAEVTTALDIGCGAGATSLALAAARPDLHVTGVDLSHELIAVARARAASLPHLRFRHGPAEAVAGTLAPLDLVVSRHGVMFFPEPVAAFGALHAAARPRARLIFSCFRAPADNPWAAEIGGAIHGAAPPPPPAGYVPGPFAFADPNRVHAILSAAGWRVADCAPVDFAYRVAESDDPVAEALDFFTHIGPAAPALRAADPDDRAAMRDRIAALLERRRMGNVVDFPAAAWLWSAQA